jgi:hypothetical protein
VVAHHVDALALVSLGSRGLLIAGTALGVGRRAAHSLLGVGDKSIHPPAVDVGYRVGGAMWSAVVQIRRVVVGGHAAAVDRVRHADAGWDPVGSREGPEVAVERAVLLHDDHDVPDLVDSGGGSDRHPEVG